MDWLDIGGIACGFVVGWIAAVVYYGRLCSLAEIAKMLTLGVWRGRG